MTSPTLKKEPSTLWLQYDSIVLNLKTDVDVSDRYSPKDIFLFGVSVSKTNS